MVAHESRINFSEIQAEHTAGCDGTFSNPVRRTKYWNFCFWQILLQKPFWGEDENSKDR
jgi:hypothetical protein